MRKAASERIDPRSIEWIDLQPEQINFRREVLAGLHATPKRLAAKFFYDARGSQLFEEITRLPEYYLTRTELAILRERAGEMTSLFGDEHALIEFGSGSSTKVRILLDASSETRVYMPVDLSADFMRESVEELALDYPELQIIAVSADYTRLPSLPEAPVSGRRVVFFPGSTIGNLEPHEAEAFFRQTAAVLRQGDGMLLGTDLKKDIATIEQAYDDASGVTAEFNRNILRRINAELGADFDVDAFEHVAFYNREAGRIEMHLRASRAMSVRLADERIDFAEGEMIHTENSYKYDLADVDALAASSQFRRVRTWTDEAARFAVHYLEVR